MLLLAALILPQFIGDQYGGIFFLAGLTLLTLSLPLSDMEYPLQWKGALRRTRAAMMLVVAGLLAIGVMVTMPGNLILLGVYGLGFILYNWTGLFR
jgi:hypothetical protein